MRAFGFQIVRCGVDGPDAWAIAAEWNKRWQAVRKGDAPALVNLDQISRDQTEATRRYPPCSIGAAFQIYIRTPEWAARAQLSRDKIWWPAWFRIRDMWGDVAPDTITFEMCRSGAPHWNRNTAAALPIRLSEFGALSGKSCSG
jgi:hypothetical protein